MLSKKDLLGLYDTGAEEITEILDTAYEMRAFLDGKEKKSDLLKGKTLITLFYENSTRTRTSFVRKPPWRFLHRIVHLHA